MSLRAPAFIKNFALAAASTVLFGGLVEGIARLIEPPPVQKAEYLWDWSERFEEGDFYTLEKGEGYPPSEETSVDGLRDATRSVEKREGLRRIAILGDSVTYGHGLEAAQAYPQILERLLRESGRDVEVFNLGLPGWSTRQERIAYERIARKYKPDVVVVAVCLNDLAELQINLSKPPGILLSLFKYSATVRMALGASKREIGAVEELFREPDSPRVERAFRLFFNELRQLKAEVAKDGASLQIVVFPFRFQVEPNAPTPSAQKRIADFAAAESIPFVDVLPGIAGAPAPVDLFLDYDHFSTAGHELVAALLADRPEIAGPPPAASGPALEPALPSALAASLRKLQAAATPDVERERTLRSIRNIASTLEVPEPVDGTRRRVVPEIVEGSGRRVVALSTEMTGLRAAVTELAVDDPSPRVRFEAAQAVFALGLPDAASVDALVRGVRHEDPRVRAFATWTLGEMREVAQPAVPALVELARQDGGAGRTGALTAIGKIGGDSPETIPLLLAELKHPKENRRYRAARTIGRMGPAAAPAVPGLVEALRDPSALVRLHVVRAFGNLGEAAKPAVPALIEVMNGDADPEVRKEVSLTLSKLPGR